MDQKLVKECILNLKIKNSEGFDRIPQRILREGIDVLQGPLSLLFKLIYEEKQIPDQWRVARTIPIWGKSLRLLCLILNNVGNKKLRSTE